jgi:predicted component of type VI protein secretion system
VAVVAVFWITTATDAYYASEPVIAQGPKALKLQTLNNALTKALAIFGQKCPWPSLRASREYHYVILFVPSFLLRRHAVLFGTAEKLVITAAIK